MIGRRHSSSVFLDGHLYVFGGAQPVGYEGNEYYTTLSSLQAGELVEESDEDERTELLIMNMNFMNFFALLFGAGPEDVGIPNPIVVGVSSEQIENGDIVISKVLASIITEEGAIEAEALSLKL